MKFGHTFDKTRDPELEGGYVEYNYLKRCIRQAEAAMESDSVSLEQAIVSAGKFTKGSYSPRASSSGADGADAPGGGGGGGEGDGNGNGNGRQDKDHNLILYSLK